MEQRLERRAVVDGLPHSAVGGADVVDGRVGLIHREIGDAARHRGRPDAAEVEALEFLGDRRGLGRQGV